MMTVLVLRNFSCFAGDSVLYLRAGGNSLVSCLAEGRMKIVEKPVMCNDGSWGCVSGSRGSYGVWWGLHKVSLFYSLGLSLQAFTY